MKTSTYIKITLSGILLTLGIFAGITVYVDPLFQYHGPVKGLEYPLHEERYMNYGIVKNFDYNSIITGTSMTQNFKTSQWDNYFGTKSVKTSLSGASYKEVNDLLECAFRNNDSIIMVMRSLDPTMLIKDKEAMSYEDYPAYLYDDNLLNDVNYVLNKEIFFDFTQQVYTHTRMGKVTTDFDAYGNWADEYQYDEKLMYENYGRAEKKEQKHVLNENQIRKIHENLEANVIKQARENPDTEFYLFIPPYSIFYWDNLYQLGRIQRTLEAHRIAVEKLVEYENIKLFSFFDMTEVVCDLNYYKDTVHYNQEISDIIMDCMATGTHRVTKENYKEYLNFISEFYGNYDYDALFE